ncbi:hypothetical protein B1207_06420 [Legionella quinlivanii]|uniref:DMT family protein n=1 Tax=Legionella quinlivanii TaxID=45073 RepID=A0A364LKD5_9GAMM|nr:DMT family protein [Legionella quinlivanii]RAP37054.1 hypothetical protein B1207_06420 [Legionella quinlivanii]
MRTILLLIGSNIFMTFAWYGHLKTLNNKPLYVAILISWGIAFFEYTLQVPANRIGFREFDLGQLKVIQEIITIGIFALFSYFYMQKPLGLNFLCAGLCMVAAAYFIFKQPF